VTDQALSVSYKPPTIPVRRVGTGILKSQVSLFLMNCKAFRAEKTGMREASGQEKQGSTAILKSVRSARRIRH